MSAPVVAVTVDVMKAVKLFFHAIYGLNLFIIPLNVDEMYNNVRIYAHILEKVLNNS